MLNGTHAVTLTKRILLSALLLSPALHTIAEDENTTADLQGAIDQQEALHGAYHPALSELHLSLGNALQQQGKHEQAIQAFKQSMHITRIDQGIQSLLQEPMLRGQIDSHRALDKPLSLATLYQRLIDLYQRHNKSRSTELIALLQEAGNWHREQYLWQRDGNAFAHLQEATRMINLANSMGFTQFSRHDIRRLPILQSQIKNHYYLTQHYTRYAPELPKGYFQRYSFPYRLRYASEHPLDYRRNVSQHRKREESRLKTKYRNELIERYMENGLGEYREITAIHASTNNTSAQATALAEQGDWLRLFKKSVLQADGLYRQSWKLLADSGDEQTLQKLFAEPQLLPVFHHKNLANHSQLSDAHLVRVQASISQAGHASRIKVLETVPESSPQVASKAHRQVRQSLFRSRMLGGKLVNSESVDISLLVDK